MYNKKAVRESVVSDIDYDELGKEQDAKVYNLNYKRFYDKKMYKSSYAFLVPGLIFFLIIGFLVIFAAPVRVVMSIALGVVVAIIVALFIKNVHFNKCSITSPRKRELYSAMLILYPDRFELRSFEKTVAVHRYEEFILCDMHKASERDLIGCYIVLQKKLMPLALCKPRFEGLNFLDDFLCFSYNEELLDLLLQKCKGAKRIKEYSDPSEQALLNDMVAKLPMYELTTFEALKDYLTFVGHISFIYYYKGEFSKSDNYCINYDSYSKKYKLEVFFIGERLSDSVCEELFDSFEAMMELEFFDSTLKEHWLRITQQEHAEIIVDGMTAAIELGVLSANHFMEYFETVPYGISIELGDLYLDIYNNDGKYFAVRGYGDEAAECFNGYEDLMKDCMIDDIPLGKSLMKVVGLSTQFKNLEIEKAV